MLTSDMNALKFCSQRSHKCVHRRELGTLRSSVLSVFALPLFWFWRQASSAPMTAIMDRMRAFGEFEVGRTTLFHVTLQCGSCCSSFSCPSKTCQESLSAS